jgi:hypothetical protein
MCAMPNGTSIYSTIANYQIPRLARVTVHFQSVLDNFTPQDTVFTFAVPSELTESALSSACLLHAASGSMTSSSSSLRRRRLMEIAEDSEEGGASDGEEPSPSPSQTAEKRKSQLSEATAVPSRSQSKEVEQSAVADPFPNTVQDHEDLRPDTASERKMFLEQLSNQPYEPRQSSQSMRPSLQDLDYAAPYRQKVKLGPRPSVDINGRPRTAGSLSRTQEHRPVAVLPAGVRSTSSRKSARPKSQHDAPFPTIASLRNAPPVPNLLIPPPTLGIVRPQLSPGAKSMTAVPSSGMSPEKQRLMKALELRKKQMEKRTQELRRKQEQLKFAGEQATADISENKENIDQSHATKKREQYDHVDIGRTPHKEPLSRLQSVAEIDSDTSNDTKPSSPDSSKPDSAVEVMDDQLDTTQPPTAPVTDVAVPATVSDTTPSSAEPKSPEEAQQEASDRQDELAEIDELETFQEAKEPSDGTNHSSNQPELPDSTQQDEEEHMVKVAVEEIPLPDSPPEVSRANSVAEGPTLEASVKDVSGRKKRAALLEPIHVPAPDFSDEDNLLSDDSFMEELKSATVLEAKPVSLGKAPLSPNGELQTPLEAWKYSRAVSNPSAGGSEIHALPAGARSVSATYNSQQVRSVPVLVAKKVNVSSGISKRIKALEMFSNAANQTPSLPTSAATRSSSPFDKFRKRASISMSGPPSITPSSKSTPYVTPSPSPDSTKVSPPNRTDSHTRSKRNSVSVTARIVRDTSTPLMDENSNSSEQGVLNLQRSPLTVERDSADTLPPPTVPPSNPTPRSPSVSSRGSRSNSIAVTITRSESRSSSHSKMDERHSRETEEKRESRATRLMRRMSSLTSSRRIVISPSNSVLQDVPASPATEEGLHPEPPQAVDIGEVNVQFPDTLLWKRRFLRIDHEGYLVLTPGNMDSSARNIVKRYHLSEFKTPCLPDEDRQELPNSILLDFRDGNTLQCSCESRKGQAAVLQSKIIHLIEIGPKLTVPSSPRCTLVVPKRWSIAVVSVLASLSSTFVLIFSLPFR